MVGHRLLFRSGFTHTVGLGTSQAVHVFTLCFSSKWSSQSISKLIPQMNLEKFWSANWGMNPRSSATEDMGRTTRPPWLLMVIILRITGLELLEAVDVSAVTMSEVINRLWVGNNHISSEPGVQQGIDDVITMVFFTQYHAGFRHRDEVLEILWKWPRFWWQLIKMELCSRRSHYYKHKDRSMTRYKSYQS